ncbi:protein-glutamine gamma-glutamyltransferase E isoform X2 [Xenopus laevis]|uniref:protein-glutamine gamma-glutamyltransferase n=1 Tax=Xenopus laevis TaxID=8355 RepID=A0A8J0U2J6_XENLA|nr:protein-glutamine gamma-glutamyltransferase E isoform X2 [Xenopus laevis]
MEESNRKGHHTEMYNIPDLILRRGQSFWITLDFDRPIQEWESIVFTAQTGPLNAKFYNINVEFALSNSWSSGMWSAVLESAPGNSLRIIMYSPANAVIGRYNLTVQISIMGHTSTYSLGKFILLFNPWCLDDEVYMANEDERNEYVMNDNGIVFIGSEKHIANLAWNFGQFESNILNICLDMLDRSLNYRNDPAADCSKRNSPMYVGRVISAMINSNDDYGVLEGKWEKEFSDGVDPNSWTGSVEILWKWQKEGYQPVKYGQCWVFAAVMCTVLRSLGIPTRVITNFNSAHNTDGNLCVDLHYDNDGKFMEVSDDSIWNFHVWDESWFLRKDLGQFYGGWQVLDSTPQEQSQNVYRCGPTSVNAVKEGDVQLPYDTPFVYSEVNADRVTWICHKDGRKEQAHSDTKAVGQFISTKAVGSNDRVDITHSYKYPEGSPKEREVFEKANRRLTNYRAPAERSYDVNNTRDRRVTNEVLMDTIENSRPRSNTLPSRPTTNMLRPRPTPNVLLSRPMSNSVASIPSAVDWPPRPRSNTIHARGVANGFPSRSTERVYNPRPPVNTFPERPPPLNTFPERPQPLNTYPDRPQPLNTYPDRPQPLNTYPERPQPLNTYPERPQPLNTYPDRPQPLNTYPERPQPLNTYPERPSLDGPDIAGKFKLLGPLSMGDDINLLLSLKNLTTYHRQITVNLSASCILYTGRRINDIFQDQKSLIVNPSQEGHISLQIPYSLYGSFLADGNMIQVVAICDLPFRKKVVITKELVLDNPPISIKPLEMAVLNKKMNVEVRFTNPVSFVVKDCTVAVEGAGLIDRQLTAVVPYIKPKQKIKFKVELTPFRSGTRQLIVHVKCRHFSIKGHQHLTVVSL